MPDSRERLIGLKSILFELNCNFDILNYFSINLHKDAFNLHNNIGLHWVWRHLLAAQILGFHKIIGGNEKHSFSKIVNISKGEDRTIDYSQIESDIESLRSTYSAGNFEIVRSKYLAHQDINVPEFKIDLISVGTFTKESNTLLALLCSVLGEDPLQNTRAVVDSLSKVFEAIDEYEKIKGYLIACSIKGERYVEIATLAKIVEKADCSDSDVPDSESIGPV